MQHPKSLLAQTLFSSTKNSNGTNTLKNCAAVTDFLRSHDKVSGLFPTVENLIALQGKCLEILPRHFSGCVVLSLNEKKLSVAVPNQSVATRLKQKLPLLQEKLIQSGWQLEGIRLKVQLVNKEKSIPVPEKKPLPPQALDAIVALRNQLGKTKGNSTLISALEVMVRRNKADISQS